MLSKALFIELLTGSNLIRLWKRIGAMADKSVPSKLAADAICKIIECKGKPLDSERSSSSQSPKDVKPPMLMMAKEVTKDNI